MVLTVYQMVKESLPKDENDPEINKLNKISIFTRF